MQPTRRWILPFVALVLYAPGSAQEPEPAPAPAAARPAAEVGMQGGLALLRAGAGADWLSVVALPGNTTYGIGAVYATLFASPTLAVEPQVALHRLAYQGGSSSLLQFQVQLMQFFRDATATSPYGALQLGIASAFADAGQGSMTLFTAGGGVGYRMVVRESLGVRLEARYRRWFGEGERDELALVLGLGGILRDAR